MDEDLIKKPEVAETEEDSAEDAAEEAAAAMIAEAIAEGAAAAAGSKTEKDGSGSSKAEKEGSGTSKAESAESGSSKMEKEDSGSSSPSEKEGSGESKAEQGKMNPADGKENIKELENIKEFNKKLTDTVQKLATGDKLVKDGDGQHLFMPNGDYLRVSRNKDGSVNYDLETKEKVQVSTVKGVTTITYGNGHSVSFDNQGIRDINRGKESVSFARQAENNINSILKPKPNGEIKPNGSKPEPGSGAPESSKPEAIKPNGSKPESGSGTPESLKPEAIKPVKPAEAGDNKPPVTKPSNISQLEEAIRRAKATGTDGKKK